MTRIASMIGGFAGYHQVGRFSNNLVGQIMFEAKSSIGWYYNSYQPDEIDYSTTWTVPVGVTSISIVCIGAGGACCWQDVYVISSGGGGGGLAYENNVSVTPGETLYIRYGRGRLAQGVNGHGAPSIVMRLTGSVYTILCGAQGGGSGTSPTSAPNLSSIPGAGGQAYVTGSTWNGNSANPISKRNGSGITATGGYGQGGTGGGGLGGNNPGGQQPMNGGGGAGGYGGNGGLGAGYYANAQAGVNGGGGGGGKGTSSTARGGAGGGTSPYGNLGNGAAGVNGNPGTRGGGGNTTYAISLNTGSDWGGGGGGVKGTDIGTIGVGGAGAGGNGVVRIIWPGTSRRFPTTNTADA